jgi:hypothetical protein
MVSVMATFLRLAWLEAVGVGGRLVEDLGRFAVAGQKPGRGHGRVRLRLGLAHPPDARRHNDHEHGDDGDQDEKNMAAPSAAPGQAAVGG